MGQPVKCIRCNTVIVSKYTHDFVTCKCGKVSVDGGNDYLKVSGEAADMLIQEPTGEWKKVTE